MPTYYDKSIYKMEGFEKSEKPDKKYYAKLRNSKTGRISKVHFGQRGSSTYKDSTGLKRDPVHGDAKRRKAFRARHKGFLKEGFYSPSFFSFYFLL